MNPTLPRRSHASRLGLGPSELGLSAKLPALRLGREALMSATPPTPPTPETPAADAPAAPPVVRHKRSRAGIAIVVVVILVVAGIAAVAYAEHWFGGNTTKSTAACTTGITLQGNGAQIVNPLLQVWATDYTAANVNQVNYVDGGSGTGLTDFSESPPIVDFAITDNPLSLAQRAPLPSVPLTLPIVGGAITAIYNLPGLTGHLNLTGAVLAEIYNGTITTWNNAAITALNPGVNLPSNTIVTVHRSDSSGATYVFTQLLSADSAAWRSSVVPSTSLLPPWPTAPKQLAVKGNALMLSTVGSTDYTIGYSDLTDTITYTTSVLQYAAIENPAGHFIVPTLANTASAINDKLATTTLPASTSDNWYNVSMVNANGSADYPVATFIYLYVYQATDKGYSPTLPKSEVIVNWLDYVLSPTAQALADSTAQELYYVPLPAAVVSVDNAGIQTMTFNGAAIPACK
jgi:phosphate transport system substrate-binding protein